MIREEARSDSAAIAALNEAAFGGTEESELIERLRADDLVALSLVAVEPGGLAGHLLLSKLSVEVEGRPLRGLSLAPMAVAPARQGRGIGSALVRAALQLAGERGWEAIVVLGHPQYYPRFGFSARLARHLAAPFSGPAFMALELVPGVLAGREGRVVYPPAFGDLA